MTRLKIIPADHRALTCFQHVPPEQVLLQQKVTSSVMLVTDYDFVLATIGMFDEGYQPSLRAHTAQMYVAIKPEAARLMLPVIRASRALSRRWARALLAQSCFKTSVIFGVGIGTRAGERAARLLGFKPTGQCVDNTKLPLWILELTPAMLDRDTLPKRNYA